MVPAGLCLRIDINEHGFDSYALGEEHCRRCGTSKALTAFRRVGPCRRRVYYIELPADRYEEAEDGVFRRKGA